MIIPSIVESLYRAGQSLIACLIRNGNAVINTLAIFTFLVVVFQFWYSLNDCRLVLFVGSPGSSTSEVGSSIAERIRLTANSGGTAYDIAMEATPENISIRDRMAAEIDRYALGLIDDGNRFEPSNDKGNSLRALLPLEWDYLYVLCSKELFKRVKAKGKIATNLGDVIDEVGPGKLYMGPEKSSTYRMATLALDTFGGVSIDKTAKGIADWREMRSALKQQDLELVFAKGPLGSTLLRQVANDDSALLIGLGDVTDSIQREGGFQVYAAELPPNLYGAQPFEIAPDYSSVFCRPGLKTLACRRVLACSQALPTADAYLLATVAMKACEDQEYSINLLANDLPNGGDRTLVSELRMPIHPGLKCLREKRPPFVMRDWSTWPTWLSSLLAVLAGLIALDLLNLLAKYLNAAVEDDRNARVIRSAGRTIHLLPKMDYSQFSGLLSAYAATLKSQSHSETAAQVDDWNTKLQELRTAINAASSISPKQREVLLEGAGELMWDVMSSHATAQNLDRHLNRPPGATANEPSVTAVPSNPSSLPTPPKPVDGP